MARCSTVCISCSIDEAQLDPESVFAVKGGVSCSSASTVVQHFVLPHFKVSGCLRTASRSCLRWFCQVLIGAAVFDQVISECLCCLLKLLVFGDCTV